MTKLSKKVFSILCVIALLVSCVAMAFAEEADEAPVWDEAQQSEAEAEAARIAAEEAEAARIAAEEAEAARIAAEEEAARIAAEEEAARIAAEEEAARKAAEEEAARKAAEEEAARKAAEEEEARKAAEEEAARKAAEEEAARKAAEEEEARKAAEEEAARKAAEEEAARKAAEEEEARKAAEEEAARKADEEEEARKVAEEEEARKAAEEEEARKTAEEEESRKAAEQESSDSNAVPEDVADENGYYEIDDSWGYVDPDVISENTPEITDELKGLRSASMNVNEILSDTISFGDELVITLKCGSAQTVDLKLYANSAMSVKVDGKAVAFTPADSDDPAFVMCTYVLENTAGRTYQISLTANDTVSFKFAAVAEQTEVQDVTPRTEEAAPVEGTNEAPASSEDNIEANIENIENTENTENNDTNTESNDANTETTDTTETTEQIETIDTTEDNNNNNEGTANNIQQIESPEPTIQVSQKTYSGLKVGNSISDTLIGGQKAKIQLKCGKHNDVKLVLNSNPDDLNVQVEGADYSFTQEADGTYTLELNNVAFRKFNILLAAKQDLAFTLSAEDVTEAEEETEPAIDTEETKPAIEENHEERVEEETGEKEEATNSGEESTDEPVAEDTEEADTPDADEVETAEEQKEETEDVEETKDAAEPLTDEQLIELGYCKVQVNNPKGIAVFATIADEAEEIEHLDFATEIWVKDTETEGWAQLYTAEEEATKYIKLAELEEKVLTDEDMLGMGYYKAQVASSLGADVYEKMDVESNIVRHLDVGEELWLKATDDSAWAELYTDSDENHLYVLWDKMIITVKPDNTEEMEDFGRSIEIHSTQEGMTSIPLGTPITLTATLINFSENDVCRYQWQYLDEENNTYVDIEGANELTYTYYVSKDNFFNTWRIVVTFSNGEQE